MYPFKKEHQVFIMGHMRSRSSLLAHIIMNNDQIFGLGESNKVYNNKYDLFKMRIKTRLKNRIYSPAGFTFLDQINHNEKTPNLPLIKSCSKFIFLLRQPNRTFESIRTLTKDYYEEWSHDRIEEYYISRLTFLKNLIHSLEDKQYIIINSDSIVDETIQCLNNISTFLNLTTPLTSRYITSTMTGVHGDPSLAIRAGYIIKNQNKPTYSHAISKQCYELFDSILSLT